MGSSKNMNSKPMIFRLCILLLLTLFPTVGSAGDAPEEYPAFIVTLKGIPTLALVRDQDVVTGPRTKILQPLFSFEYYYTVSDWSWGAIISQSGSDRKPWSVKPPLLTVRDRLYSYTGEVGTFPCTMDIRVTQPGSATVSWDHNLILGEEDYLERREIRTSSERGILLKIPAPGLLRDIKRGNPGDRLLVSFAYQGKPYRLELTGSQRVEKISFKKSPAGQLWLGFTLPAATPDHVRFATKFTYPSEVTTHLDYERLARRHFQQGWLACNLEDDSWWLDVGSSLLDPPAGKYGFLTVRNGRFYFQKQDTPVFLSGTTYVHSSKFPDKKTARTFAKRTAAMGFNLVRFHHLDYHIPGFGLFDRQGMKEGRTDAFDPVLLDRMDYFIFCLKQLGIYIHLDGITARRFLENDGVSNYDKISGGLKGGAYILDSDILRAKQKHYLRALWNHVNPYTGLAYKDDPAIVTTALLNENDLYTHGSFKHHIPEPYRDIYLAGKKNRLKKNGATYPARDYDRELLYKRDLTTDYFRYFGEFTRKNNPLRPFCGTNWIDSGSRLRLLSSYGLTDFTADHPYSHHLLDEEKLDLFRPGVKHLSYINLAKLWDKPLMHEEWTSNGLDRAASLSLAMALMTAQDHDATINFAMYHSYPVEKHSSHIGTYNMAYDPARAALLPALNLMFIRRDLKPDPRRIAYLLDENILFGKGPASLLANGDVRNIYPSYEPASFTARTGFVTSEGQIPTLLKRFPGTEIVTPGKPPANLPDSGTYPLVSGSGEIKLYWKERFFLVTAERTKMAMGYYGAKGPLDLGDGVRVNITTPGYICLALTSLTDDPIAISPRIMLTVFSHAEAAGTLYNEQWREPILPDTDVLMRPVEGSVTLMSSYPGRQASARWYNLHHEPGGLLSYSQTREAATLTLDGKGIVALLSRKPDQTEPLGSGSK